MSAPAGERVERLVVDRVEGDLAAVEVAGRGVLDLPTAWLPVGAREGDVLRLRVSEQGGSRLLELSRDPEATGAARDEALARLERLRARDPGGDVAL